MHKNKIKYKKLLYYSRKYVRDAHTYLPYLVDFSFMVCTMYIPSYRIFIYVWDILRPAVVHLAVSLLVWFFLTAGERAHFLPIFLRTPE